MGITKGDPAPICLDLTRLVSRIGQGPMTGIDRVELAYLNAILERDRPCFALVRLSGGMAVLGRAGMEQLRDRINGHIPWGPADAAARLRRRMPEMRRRVQSDVRRLALGRDVPVRLHRLLVRSLPARFSYLNVGHTNLDLRVLSALRKAGAARIAVMLHDTIPLDHPRLQRKGQVERFQAIFQLVIECADMILCPSHATRADILRHAGDGPTPPIQVALLGVSPRVGRPDRWPGTLPPEASYLVVLGTIEPRKNHRLLLDVWDRLAKDPAPPRLVVIGRRGWNNEAVFARLDRGPPAVHEFNDLDDETVAAVLARARALLFPSLAEGFGLPAAEAAVLGVPVICSDLPVFHEVLGDYPIYLDPKDMYSWETKIRNLVKQRETGNSKNDGHRQAISLPTWEEHFNLVLRLM